jgi:hypothetical protein
MATNKHAQRLLELQAKKAQGDLLKGLDEPQPQAAPKKPAPARKAAPKAPRKKAAVASQDPVQADFYAPVLCDVGSRDSRTVMDVAVFRLSKSDKRANTILTYTLPDGGVQVTSGPLGMASVYDYDIVLMAVSHLTEAMNRHREGKGAKPGQVFRPAIADVLNFCRRDNGGNQKDAVVGALERLSTTHVKIERTRNVGDKPMTITEGENLIGPFKVLSNPRTKKVEAIEFRVAQWMYDEITAGHQPEVLTVNPDYFKIERGLARFVYRLARRAAGKDSAAWSFGTIYERSGSQGSRKEFNRMIRAIIKDDNLPDYSLAEEQGKADSILRMVHRSQADKWKLSPDSSRGASYEADAE